MKKVVNTGFTAVNSYTLWDLTDSVIEQKPELVINYACHNEYHGKFGAGSSVSFGSHPDLVRTYLFLKNFHLFQMLDNGYSRIFNHDSNKPRVGETTLMEVMRKTLNLL